VSRRQKLDNDEAGKLQALPFVKMLLRGERLSELDYADARAFLPRIFRFQLRHSRNRTCLCLGVRETLKIRKNSSSALMSCDLTKRAVRSPAATLGRDQEKMEELWSSKVQSVASFHLANALWCVQ
jgi:hypothetical protein